MTKITFVVAYIIFKVAIITFTLAKISFVVAELTFKIAVITSSVVKITFVVAEITFRRDSNHFFGGKDHFCSG